MLSTVLAAIVASSFAGAVASSAEAESFVAGNSRGDRVLVFQPGNRWGTGAFGPVSTTSAASGAPFGALAGGSARLALRDVRVAPDGTLFIPTTSAGPGWAIKRPGASDFEPNGLPAGYWGPSYANVGLVFNSRSDALFTSGTSLVIRSAAGDFGPTQPMPAPMHAVAFDDDGGALFLTGSGPTWASHNISYYRAADGTFGEPVDLGVSPPGYGLYPTVASGGNGHALIVWKESARDRPKPILVATRSPGMRAFGPAQEVAPGFTPSDVTQVAIADSGAAAILAWTTGTAATGYRGTYYLLARKPDGSFDPPEPLPNHPGFYWVRPRLAVNDDGAIVVVWPTGPAGVAAVFRPPGGPFMSPITVAPEPAVALGYSSWPNVSLASSGRATAVWEQSDGDHANLRTSDFDATAVGSAIEIGSVLAHPTTPRKLDFRYTVAHSKHATVQQRDPDPKAGGGDLFACLDTGNGCFSLGSLTPLVSAGGAALAGGTVTNVWFRGSLKLADPFAAVAATGLPSGARTLGTYISVDDLRGEEGFSSRLTPAGPTRWSEVPALRLTNHGSVAWISCSSKVERTSVTPHCAGPSSKIKRLYTWIIGQAQPTLVSAGKQIRMRTLRLRGSRLMWREGSRLRSAVMP